MPVLPGSDIKVFVPFDQLRHEFLHGSNPEAKCAYLINSDHRCAERFTVQQADFPRVIDFFQSNTRTAVNAKQFRRYFLCQQHIKDTARMSDGFFLRAGWCTRVESVQGTETASSEAISSTSLNRKKSQKVVTLNVSGDRLAEISTANTTQASSSASASENPHAGSPGRGEKRRTPPDQNTAPSKRHKSTEEVADAHINPTRRIPFSPAKLLTLTPGSQTDARRMRPCKRSIDRTPSFSDTYDNIFRQDRHECVGLASKTLQRCRRPIVVDKLMDRLQWTPMILTQQFLWDMLHSLLCEKHASEQQRYTILQRWSVELSICESRAQSPEAILPTPATSPIPPSPRSRREEVDLTLESDVDTSGEQVARARDATLRREGTPSPVVHAFPEGPVSSNLHPPPNPVLPSETRKEPEQQNSGMKPRKQRRGTPRPHSPAPQIQETNPRHGMFQHEAQSTDELIADECVRDGKVAAATESIESSVEEQNSDDVIGSTAEAAGNNLDLENSDMPTLSVNDAQPDPFPSSMPWQAYVAVKDEMLKPIDQEGFVYVIRSRSRPGLVKVGKAVNIEERIKEIQRTCKLDDLESVRDTMQTKIYHAAKLERLVHKELTGVQKADFKCNNPDHASKGVSHREWFEIDGSVAVNVVQRWRTWLKSKPYGDVRIQNLSEKWVHTIENHFPEPEKDEEDVHDHGRRNQKFDAFVNFGLGMQ